MNEIKSREKQFYISLMEQSDQAKIEKICKALSSPIRLQMIRQIIDSPQTITQLAKLNEITNSTVIFHINILKDASLINIKYMPSQKGFAQVCFINFQEITFGRRQMHSQKTFVHEQSMGVGRFVDAKFDTVAYATKNEIYHLPASEAFSSIRFDAELLWTFGGTVTYAFENNFLIDEKITELRFTLEICSEASYYKNDWKSDITFAVNGKELATYTSPGDFGGTRGKLNPAWWPNNLTQYGSLVTVSVTEKGTSLNNIPTSKVTLKDLNLSAGNKILFTICNKRDAKYYGGFNLFGKSFGNYEQEILLTALYEKS